MILLFCIHMNTLSDEIFEMLRNFTEERHNGNKASAARELGVSQVTFTQWLNRVRTPNLAALDPVFKALGVKLAIPGKEFLDYDYVPKIAAKAGAGASLETNGDLEGLYAFRKDFMGIEHISAAHSVLMDVVGDSMEPLFSEGDTLLVDKSDIEVMDGKIYVVTLGDELRVKRVQKTLRGLLLRSENPKYADVPVEGPDLENFVVHGRVRWCGKVF